MGGTPTNYNGYLMGDFNSPLDDLDVPDEPGDTQPDPGERG